MKVQNETTDKLIFEEHPRVKPVKIAVFIILILVFLFITSGLLTKRIIFSDLILPLILILIIIFLFVFFSASYLVRVIIDRKSNQISILDKYNQDINIPLNRVNKIEYRTWVPNEIWSMPIWQGFLINSEKLVFKLNDNSEVSMNIKHILTGIINYNNIGKKIAGYLNVPFTYHKT